MLGTRTVNVIVPELPAGTTSSIVQRITPPLTVGSLEKPPVEAVPATYVVATDE
ncbi:hypothetical protein [Microbacterium foliorum]|uniref:hypothetical protein n=1 Tax=Microbacterium foliorum TaxID=104336 RepID=UPI00142F3198|nr:hypothetical protein [Microbacterium foliorum]